jgi:hypothetical protein
MIRHLRRRYLAVSILVICAMMAVGCNQGAKEPVDPPPKIKFADVNGVVSFACSPDGQLLAVCFEKEGTKRRIGIWELATGEQKTEMDEPEGAKLIAFTPDGQKLVGFIYVCVPPLRFPRENDPKSYCEFKLWDAGTGNVVRTGKLPEFPGGLVDWTFLSFTEDNCACAMYRQRLAIFNIENGTVDPGVEQSARAELNAYASKTGLIGIVGERPQQLVLYKPGEKDPSQKAPLALVAKSLAVSQDGKTIALSYNETGEEFPKRMFGRTELWDVATWRLRSTLPAADAKESFTYNDLALSPTVSTLLAVSGTLTRSRSLRSTSGKSVARSSIH